MKRKILGAVLSLSVLGNIFYISAAEQPLVSLSSDVVLSEEEMKLDEYSVYASANHAVILFPDNKITCQPGDSVNFCVSAEEGYEISEILVYDANGEIPFTIDGWDSDSYTFTMPENEVFIEVIATDSVSDQANSLDAKEEEAGVNTDMYPDDTETITAGIDTIVKDMEKELLEDNATEIPELTVSLTPVPEEESDIIGEEISEDLLTEASHGGYVLDGYLKDGTPNYIWIGEGIPAMLEDYGIMLLSEASGEPEAVALQNSSGSNYLKDAIRILNKNAEMSDESSSMTDGLHRMANGKVRAFKGGKYFKNGRFGLNGDVYYADTDGYLYSGWLAVSKTDDISSKKKSNYVWKYCDPTTYIRYEDGVAVIDGTSHYFIPEESGNLGFNKVVPSSGNAYYYCDNYGVCGVVKLKYDSSSATDPYPDSAYLAVNQLPKENVVNLYEKVMDGSYSFYPKWYRDVSRIEVFGFTPVSTSSGTTVYCPLTDNSLKGKIGCWYYNVGKYNGRQIDIKCTITDYTFYSFRGDNEVGYFQVSLNKIGLNATNLRDITANMEFYDHETKQPVKVKGFATFADIDISQGLEIISGTDHIYVDENCKLYKDPAKNLFTAPWEEKLNGSLVDDADREYWVQADYDSYNLSYKFCSARENYSMADNGLFQNINGESKCVWTSGYTGNVNEYDIVNTSQGVLWQGWQGLYYGRLGRVSISPLTKTVSDADETNVTKNALDALDESFTYKLYHYVPSETEPFYYDSYEVYDVISEDLSIDASSLKVELDDGTDVTGFFRTSLSGQKVIFAATEEALAAENFYNNNYCFCITVSIKSSADLDYNKENGYSVKNVGHAVFSRTLPTGIINQETTDSNQTETTFEFPWISIKKTDSMTNEILKGAEFTAYEYSVVSGTYKETGINIPYSDTQKAYVSPRLTITMDNQGKFRIAETNPPEGYKGEWETLITLPAKGGEKPNEEFIVTNEPDILPRGEITVTKKIKESDIIWAHGNPTFLFKVSGKDIRGNEHTYEDCITFQESNYKKEADGYAVLQVTFQDIPIGTYDVTEKQVLRYYLAEAVSNTANVQIHQTGSPAYGKDPSMVAYGTAVLSLENPKASITFRNEKSRYDDYSHTDIIKNTVSFLV